MFGMFYLLTKLERLEGLAHGKCIQSVYVHAVVEGDKFRFESELLCRNTALFK